MSTKLEISQDPATYQKVLVCGELTRRGDAFVATSLDKLNAEIDIGTIVHDGYSRVGILSGKWATKNNINQIIFPHFFYGTKDEPIDIRNQKMLLSKPDVAVVFSGGQGNSDMLKRADKRNIRVWAPT